MAEQIIEFEAMEQAVSLFGSFDENVKLIENEYDVSIISRGSELKVMGDVENVDKAARALRSMLAMINKGESLTEQNVRYVLTLVNEGNEDKIASMSSGSICISSKGRPIKPKTLGQKRYCDAILNNTITFGIGPAGTGKTYLAVAMAVTAFRAKEVDRIILTRPAVEAGEKLGFLPESHNDMIFAIICEELGLFGALCVIALFVMLIVQLRYIANHARDRYGALVVTGVMTHIAVQMIINIGVVTNVIPNTGVPLPFISYGGTSLAFLMVEMGFVLSVSRQMLPYEAPTKEELQMQR